MPELLFLAQRIPYPPNKGEKIRQFQILRHLAERYTVHLGCLIDDPADWQHVETINAMCGETYFARLDPRLAKLTCLRGLLANDPLSVPYFYDRGLARWVVELIERRRLDAAFICSSQMAQYLLALKRRPPRVVMDFTDVDSDKWRQYAQTQTWPMSWVYGRESRTLLDFERRVGRDFDASVFVSRAEAELFRRLAPESAGKVHFVNNGVDLSYFSPDHAFADPYEPGRTNVVFTGTMSYWPNVDAVTWFVEEILPLARAEVPALGFCIVGASPTRAVDALAKIPGVTVTGRVPDVRPYVAHAAAAVAPLRIANGVQNKVLEAMAMAKIIVATPRALAGVEPEAARHVLVAEGARSFAGEIVRAIRGDGIAELGRNARQGVLQCYDWQKNLAALAPLLAP